MGDYNSRHNQWSHLVADVKSTKNVPIKINQDVNIYVCELDLDQEVSFQVLQKRQVYFVCMEGNAIISGSHGEVSVERHDAAEIFGPNEISIKAVNLAGKTSSAAESSESKSDHSSAAHLMIIEMVFEGNGRLDL